MTTKWLVWGLLGSMCHVTSRGTLGRDTKDQWTNILSKSLQRSRINNICGKLGTYDLYAPPWEVLLIVVYIDNIDMRIFKYGMIK